MYGRLATILGYRFDEIEKTPLSFIVTLSKYWVVEPPVHDLVRYYLDYKAPVISYSQQPIISQQVSRSAKQVEGDIPSSAEMLQLRAMGSKEFGGNVLPFDCVPTKVQEWLSKNVKVDRKDKAN